MPKLSLKSRIIGHGEEAPDNLTANPLNFRRHPKEQLNALRGSMKELGWIKTVIVNKRSGYVLDGHARVEEAIRQGLPSIPVTYVDLDENEEKLALAVLDPITELAYRDDETLKLLLEQANASDQDLKDFLLTLNNQESESGLLPSADEDEVPDPPKQAITKLGDLIILGNHRLLCGDATKTWDVEKLMDGKKADMVFTDPPYNIDYQGVKDKRAKIKNDKMSNEAFEDLLIESLYKCETMYVCCSWHNADIFKHAMESIGRKPKAMIVWDKVNPSQHLDKYFKQHELIYYYGDFGGHKTVRGDVWTLKRQKNTVHPTMKPIELIEFALNDQPDKNIVFDCFGGSGSTLIACEKTNRQCYMMELDPIYCDVIIERWEKATGKKAIRQ